MLKKRFSFFPLKNFMQQNCVRDEMGALVDELVNKSSHLLKHTIFGCLIKWSVEHFIKHPKMVSGAFYQASCVQWKNNTKILIKQNAKQKSWEKGRGDHP
jgi:hypothetical protein